VHDQKHRSHCDLWFLFGEYLMKYKDTEDSQRICDNGSESYSATGVSKMFPTVATWLG
jgi:hypothetical protein